MTVGCCAAAIMAFCWLVDWNAYGQPPAGLSKRRLAFIAALGTRRIATGRLVAFPYARAGGIEASVGLRLVRAARGIEVAAAERPTPGRLGDRALVSLLAGKVEVAVRDLEEASRQRPVDARLMSDLGAAYLARYEALRQSHDLLLAVTVLDHAVAADPQLPEAQFNRALALSRFFLLSQARAAWKSYLRLDPASGWAGEARRNLDGLTFEPESLVLSPSSMRSRAKPDATPKRSCLAPGLMLGSALARRSLPRLSLSPARSGRRLSKSRAIRWSTTLWHRSTRHSVTSRRSEPDKLRC
jgi:tetratricopeptide (TPR) repeat protein